MGCASSKRAQTRRCQHCQTPYHSSPLPRSYSVPVHHPASRKGDSYHVVALTSSTLGSLPRDSIDFDQDEQSQLTLTTKTSGNYKHVDDEKGKEFLREVLEAKNWSSMIEEKIPKVIPRTPTRTPPGEPETINTWEMMEGLDDHSPLRLLPNRLHERAFSFHAVSSNNEDTVDSPTVLISKSKLLENDIDESFKPQWMGDDDDSVSNLSTVISEFDPEIVSQFRKALEELSPVPTAHLKSPEREKTPYSKEINFLMDTKVEDIIIPSKSPPQGEDKVVIYFTSLRGVRKTYEDCCDVRIMLKGFGVRVDERDVSMHYVFREELKELSEEIGCNGGLPRVFVKGKYIGGAEEIRQLNEDGKLEKLVQGCALMEQGNGMQACELCGDVRFVPCENCSGSCKIYCEEGDEWDGEEAVGEFQRCPDCNENGIVRCPVCCY